MEIVSAGRMAEVLPIYMSNEEFVAIFTPTYFPKLVINE